jgi:hypothetical protein
VPTEERIEDWPPSVREILSHGLPRQIDLVSGGTWHFDVAPIDMLDPENKPIIQECRAVDSEQLFHLVLMNRNKYPTHLFEFIGLDAPAEGMGPVTWPFADGLHQVQLAIRRMRAYTRGSDVFAEVEWTNDDAGVDRIVNASFARPRTAQREITDAYIGLLALLSMTPPAGGRHSLEEDTESGWIEQTQSAIAFKHQHRCTWEVAASHIGISTRQLNTRRERLRTLPKNPTGLPRLRSTA